MYNSSSKAVKHETQHAYAHKTLGQGMGLPTEVDMCQWINITYQLMCHDYESTVWDTGHQNEKHSDQPTKKSCHY